MKVLSLLKVMPGLLFDIIFIWLYLSIEAVGHFSEIRIVFFTSLTVWRLWSYNCKSKNNLTLLNKKSKLLQKTKV